MRCAQCGREFEPTSKHVRKYCDAVCTLVASRKTYRAKPEVKARHAAKMREKRALMKSAV